MSAYNLTFLKPLEFWVEISLVSTFYPGYTCQVVSYLHGWYNQEYHSRLSQVIPKFNQCMGGKLTPLTSLGIRVFLHKVPPVWVTGCLRKSEEAGVREAASPGKIIQLRRVLGVWLPRASLWYVTEQMSLSRGEWEVKQWTFYMNGSRIQDRVERFQEGTRARGRIRRMTLGEHQIQVSIM